LLTQQAASAGPSTTRCSRAFASSHRTCTSASSRSCRAKQRNALQQAAPVADVNLGPKITFDTLTVEELAAKVHGDANIRQLVIDKALNGTPEEKKKASETIARASGAGQ
jgi:hypothetical protein